MEVKLEMEQDVLTARLRGELDHHTAAALRQKIDTAVESHHPKTLILDFSHISFMDSSGIGLILGRYKLMRGKGGLLKVKGASPRQLQVMKMAGLEKLDILEKEGMTQDETHQ
jgi:stage II sporulation protein AA (anti-sigma F factor antagonist)